MSSIGSNIIEEDKSTVLVIDQEGKGEILPKLYSEMAICPFSSGPYGQLSNNSHGQVKLQETKYSSSAIATFSGLMFKQISIMQMKNKKKRCLFFGCGEQFGSNHMILSKQLHMLLLEADPGGGKNFEGKAWSQPNMGGVNCMNPGYTKGIMIMGFLDRGDVDVVVKYGYNVEQILMVVYYAELRGERATIKKMDMQASREFLNEGKVVTHVPHLDLVHLLGYCVKGSQCLVYEYFKKKQWDLKWAFASFMERLTAMVKVENMLARGRMNLSLSL